MSNFNIFERILERLETDKECRLRDIEYLQGFVKGNECSPSIKEYYEVLVKHNEEKIKGMTDINIVKSIL